MTNIYNELTDEEFMDLWDAHPCSQEDCELCYEFMLRFNPKRLTQLTVGGGFRCQRCIKLGGGGKIKLMTTN